MSKKQLIITLMIVAVVLAPICWFVIAARNAVRHGPSPAQLCKVQRSEIVSVFLLDMGRNGPMTDERVRTVIDSLGPDFHPDIDLCPVCDRRFTIMTDPAEWNRPMLEHASGQEPSPAHWAVICKGPHGDDHRWFVTDTATESSAVEPNSIEGFE